MNQITSCTFFKLKTIKNQWWAFTQMQMAHKKIKSTPGLLFYKLLGSGAHNGFSILPNFKTYALLCVWESENDATDFFTSNSNSYFHSYKKRCEEEFTIFLNPAEVHGFWDNQQPFQKNTTLDKNSPIVVLTRARIRFKKLLSFWSKVRTVSHSLKNYKGLAFSIGVGEWPLIQQATISVWKTQAEMIDYAYKNPKHKEVIAQTRKLNWYSEELFARFVPYKIEGTWNGKDAKHLLNI